jgi:predicted adenylyl cyclase CyaB
MPREIEAKFPVRDFRAVRKALRAAGAEHVATVLQTDQYFDTPDGSLKAGDCAVRLRGSRLLRAAGARGDLRPLLTYKGPRLRSARVKSRVEIQTRIDDPRALEHILGTCGLQPVMVIQKRRASYRIGRSLVELDELPLIGRFVEIEASSEKRIWTLRRKLGLDSGPITDSYTNLVEAACRAANARCAEVTFERFGSPHRRD